jgi:hypothetical protein
LDRFRFGFSPEAKGTVVGIFFGRLNDGDVLAFEPSGVMKFMQEDAG